MPTKFSIDKFAAKKLAAEHGCPGVFGESISLDTLSFFEQYSCLTLDIGCRLVYVASTGTYKLVYGEVLKEVPEKIVQMGITLLSVELYAPYQPRVIKKTGTYEWIRPRATATVKNVRLVDKNAGSKSVARQSITVTAPTLAQARKIARQLVENKAQAHLAEQGDDTK